MSYKLTYHHEIKDDLAAVPKNIKDRIRHAVENRLMVDPISYGVPLRKSLHGYYKLRVGDYRIIFQIEGQHILILKIGHRKDVYPKVLRRL